MTAISGMASLSVLDLSDNSFTGPLPTLNGAKAGGGGTNDTLTWLDLSGNAFEGPLWDMTIHASDIDLSDNALTGIIPRGLFGSRTSDGGEPDIVDELIDFFGGDDAFFVPSTVALDRASLDLSNNQLRGFVPESVAGFHGHVDVSDNRLWGPIPWINWLAYEHDALKSRDFTRLYRGNDCLTAQNPDHAQDLFELDPLYNNGC